MRASAQSFSLRLYPKIPESLSRLEDIASDLWFSWNSTARALFHQLDENLWTVCGHNPKAFLKRVNQERLDELARDRSFLSQYHGVVSDFEAYQSEEHQWFADTFEDAADHHIAYFSAEFGMHESLPIYSGGLGMLAGDHCKSASDLGLPFTAVGLLYRQGYFTQQINVRGQQEAIYHDSRFDELCIEPARNEDGSEMIFQLNFDNSTTDVKVWIANAGHIRMVLLDTDLSQNGEESRGITHQLYGGGIVNRIKQEIVLGIGGVRALRLLGISPTVWHANEGHAAFTILERLRELVKDEGLSFEQALEAVRANTIFTTHTPVAAGHDIFTHELFDRYMSNYASDLGITQEQLHALGHADFGHGSEGFNQTALAVHGSAYINGVARLHGEVSSTMFQQIWPDLTPEENPVTSVTNGVHAVNWLSPEWFSTFDRVLGGRWRGRLLHGEFWEKVNEIQDPLFWSIHQTNKQRMLQYVRQHLEYQAERNGESSQIVKQMTANFDARTLVIGFARRFATYKRATLLFEDETRLKNLLDEVGHPVVFLFAGKAHPADMPGQELIRRIHEISRKPGFIGRVLMLESYDMTLARYLVSGVDLWLNNPVRPLEASGTSGMKAAMNGIPNMSILDGWWPEGYHGDNGWAIGGERDIADETMRNHEDSESLYHLLCNEVIPTYYKRNESGYSDAWVKIAKRAMISSIPEFNTDRMVSEYTERFYVPASRHGAEMRADGFRRAKELAAWKAKVRKSWDKVRLAPVGKLSEPFERPFGEPVPVTIQVQSDGISPDHFRAEVVLMRPSRSGGFRRYKVVPMEHGEDGLFSASLELEESGDFTYQVRLYPFHPDLAHPLHMGMMKYL